MSGVEEGGGEPSSGIPPTKKAPTLCQHRSLHGSFNFPPADFIGSERLNESHHSGQGSKGKRLILEKKEKLSPRRPLPVCRFGRRAGTLTGHSLKHGPVGNPSSAARPA